MKVNMIGHQVFANDNGLYLAFSLNNIDSHIEAKGTMEIWKFFLENITGFAEIA